VHLIIKLAQAPSTSPANNSEFPMDIDATVTVEELKQQIAARAGLPRDHMRLVCAGRIWQDSSTVGSYEPRVSAIVHCLTSPPRAIPAPADQTLAAANPLHQMMGGGAPWPAVGGGDPMQQMMAQSQQMIMQNPEMVQEMLQNPMVQQMISDPEMVRAMMRMNPQLEQLMERQPEIARLLEDPEMLQQSMRMAANPSLMREMTRNADRAIGRLDVTPGGHNALVRAHQEVADPLFDALAGSAGASEGITTASSDYGAQTEGRPTNDALPNPWGPPADSHNSPEPASGATLTPGVGSEPPHLALLQAMGGATQVAGGQPSLAQNPMGAMMQQMMSNPAHMQQMMAMAQQLMVPQTGAERGVHTETSAPSNIFQNPLTAAMPSTPAGAVQTGESNPMAAVMQQMLGPQSGLSPNLGSNPMMAMMMQQMMAPGGQEAMAELGAQGTPPLTSVSLRMRFAGQLAQLAAMGFSNEEACLRALVQHNGRLDSAIDTLITSTDSSA